MARPPRRERTRRTRTSRPGRTDPGANATTPSAAPGSPAERDQTDAEPDDHQERADDGPHRVAGHRGATDHPQALQRPDGADHDQHPRDDQHDDLHQELLSAGTYDVATIAQSPVSHQLTGHPPLRWCHPAARNAEYHVWSPDPVPQGDRSTTRPVMR